MQIFFLYGSRAATRGVVLLQPQEICTKLTDGGNLKRTFYSLALSAIIWCSIRIIGVVGIILCVRV